MAKMWRIKGTAENSYFRDGINPGPYVVLNKEVMTIIRRRITRRKSEGRKVRELSLNAKSWWNFTPKPWVHLQAKF